MQKIERVVVSNPVVGICYMQVCAVKDATNKEILDVANRDNPSGTRGGWSSVIRSKEGSAKPCQCAEHKGRMHFLCVC